MSKTKKKDLKKRIAQLEDRVEDLEDGLDATDSIVEDCDIDAMLEAIGHVLALTITDPTARQAIIDKSQSEEDPFDYEAEIEAVYSDYGEDVDDEEFDEMCSRLANVDHNELVYEFERTIIDAMADAFNDGNDEEDSEVDDQTADAVDTAPDAPQTTAADPVSVKVDVVDLGQDK